MLYWTIEKLILQLKHAWSISRGSATTKTNFYIKVSDGKVWGLGETAPNARYGETPEKILSEFAIALNNELPIVKSVEQLHELLNNFKISNALKCGIETAFIDYWCKKNKISPFKLLGSKAPAHVATAFTIPIIAPEKVVDFHLKFHLNRFKYIKVKIDKNQPLELINEVHKHCEQPLIIDPNEAFNDVDELLKVMDACRHMPILLFEQPMPSYMHDEYKYLKKQCKFPVFADESVLTTQDLPQVKKEFDGVNIKLMKCGGLKNALKLLKEAKMYQLQAMIGCMVETTVGIRNAYYLASEAQYIDLDSFMYIDSEPKELVGEENGMLKLLTV